MFTPRQMKILATLRTKNLKIADVIKIVGWKGTNQGLHFIMNDLVDREYVKKSYDYTTVGRHNVYTITFKGRKALARIRINAHI